MPLYYIHKYEISQRYGGLEEGGWWFDYEQPIEDWVPLAVTDEDAAYDMCRLFNEQEHARREGLRYGYTSVLSHREEFFTFTVTESVIPDQPRVPHYE